MLIINNEIIIQSLAKISSQCFHLWIESWDRKLQVHCFLNQSRQLFFLLKLFHRYSIYLPMWFLWVLSLKNSIVYCLIEHIESYWYVLASFRCSISYYILSQMSLSWILQPHLWITYIGSWHCSKFEKI